MSQEKLQTIIMQHFWGVKDKTTYANGYVHIYIYIYINIKIIIYVCMYIYICIYHISTK